MFNIISHQGKGKENHSEIQRDTASYSLEWLLFKIHTHTQKKTHNTLKMNILKGLQINKTNVY